MAFRQGGRVNVETIRFYQRKGLLLEPDKPMAASAAMARRM
ncbi:mercuric resistance operon regulatory protein [Pseudomonas aeruginosa]|nr:mercuric resistance operon regulatory protein [Pseudomonas aeruginosa]